MTDPNAKRKRQFMICFAILMVILLLAFLCMKYINKDVTIYKKDIINNSVQIPFEIRDMMVSQGKKRLYTLGHDRDGISVIDISNLNRIELLGLFYFPEARYNVENIQAAESNDGESLYVASRNLGILRLDVIDPKNIKIAAKF